MLPTPNALPLFACTRKQSVKESKKILFVATLDNVVYKVHRSAYSRCNLRKNLSSFTVLLMRIVSKISH